jgi:hypothetical protein
MREHRGNLKRSNDAAARNLRRLMPGDIRAVEMDAAARWSKKLGQQIESCRLACAVGTDQRVDAAALDFETNVVDGNKAFEFLHQTSRLEYVIVGHRPAP